MTFATTLEPPSAMTRTQHKSVLSAGDAARFFMSACECVAAQKGHKRTVQLLQQKYMSNSQALTETNPVKKVGLLVEMARDMMTDADIPLLEAGPYEIGNGTDIEVRKPSLLNSGKQLLRGKMPGAWSYQKLASRGISAFCP